MVGQNWTTKQALDRLQNPVRVIFSFLFTILYWFFSLVQLVVLSLLSPKKIRLNVYVAKMLDAAITAKYGNSTVAARALQVKFRGEKGTLGEAMVKADYSDRRIAYFAKDLGLSPEQRRLMFVYFSREELAPLISP
ncbi:MAG: hypothetical protein HYU97_11270 [Deltaproteobacteria bacterium]|nr:hypothetical protein [Deltaproteobacteria bacterium]